MARQVGRAAVCLVAVLAVVGAVAAERAGRQRFAVLDLATGLVIAGAGLVGLLHRRGRVAGALLVAAAASWFVSIPAPWSVGLPGDVAARTAWLHRALVTAAVVVAAGADDLGPRLHRRLRLCVRSVVLATALVAGVDRDFARSIAWTAGGGAAVVVCLLVESVAQPFTQRRWTARHAGAAAAGIVAWVVAATIGRTQWTPATRLAVYDAGLVAVAVTVAAWSATVTRPSAVLAEDGHGSRLRFGFESPERAMQFEDLNGTPFTPAAGEFTATVDTGETGLVMVAAPAGSPAGFVLERELAGAVALLAANHRALSTSRRRSTEVAESSLRTARAEELAALALGAELERAVVVRVDRARQLLAHRSDPIAADACRALAAVREEVRAIAGGMMPGALGDGLPAALRSLAASAGVPTEVEVAPMPPERVGGEVARTVYFAAAECLANVSRHAGATRVRLSLHADATGLQLTVDDDGVGGAAVVPGGGLAGLHRRVDQAGGSFTVGDRPGGGTVATVWLPLTKLS